MKKPQSNRKKRWKTPPILTSVFCVLSLSAGAVYAKTKQSAAPTLAQISFEARGLWGPSSSQLQTLRIGRKHSGLHWLNQARRGLSRRQAPIGSEGPDALQAILYDSHWKVAGHCHAVRMEKIGPRVPKALFLQCDSSPWGQTGLLVSWEKNGVELKRGDFLAGYRTVSVLQVERDMLSGPAFRRLNPSSPRQSDKVLAKAPLNP